MNNMENISIVTDMNDVILQKGDKVIWHDPEFEDNTPTYEVYEEPTEEMVKLSSEFGECEALPEECEVIWDADKIDRWVEYCAGGCAIELLDTFPFTDKELQLIQKVELSDVSDSDYADFILEVALEHVKH